MKATAVHVCIFTNLPANAGVVYAPDMLPDPERSMYNNVAQAATQLFNTEGISGTSFSMCYAPEFKDFLSGQTLTPPFIGIAGTFPGGSKKLYTVKTGNALPYLRAMWKGEFGGTGQPGDLTGDGSGGSGSGDNFLCKIFPPLCTLGFWPWLALAAFTTYRASEANSTLGRGLWGVAALYTWKNFADRGGFKQLGEMVGVNGMSAARVVRIKGQFTNPVTLRESQTAWVAVGSNGRYGRLPGANSAYLPTGGKKALQEALGVLVFDIDHL